MQTLKELKKYFEDECYSKVIIGKHPFDDRFIIWQEENKFFFGYSERGRISIIKEFDAEYELVAYTLGKLENDIWAKAHLAAWTWNEKDILAAEHELERMHISFKRNDIPHFDIKHGRAYRIFVFGRDILKLSSFKKRYIKQYPSISGLSSRWSGGKTERIRRKTPGERALSESEELRWRQAVWLILW